MLSDTWTNEQKSAEIKNDTLQCNSISHLHTTFSGQRRAVLFDK